ncbi:sulfite exporter TauE/SafE family protein [Candidatus Vondammii sp. HM_W22]|uniref:sulfite exporter TauE/SafE family protein n=1 Tax=Candidatus Vondammii sp. HM_W22 TaxID=2687299 RepID=UPI001F13530A|nr:sulfite exporter TauE/SafE family protein [Candidatus Vondammii sp. HM_W22]
MEFTYALAFTTGIMGTFHCLGMCGGLASGFFAGHGSRQGLCFQVTYHGTRIAVYVVFGVLGALIGRVLVQAGIVGKGQGILMIITGTTILLIGLWLSELIPGFKPTRCSKGCTTPLAVRFGHFKKPGKYLPSLAGMLNGLVPCSLLFSMGVKAVATADPLRAGLLMLCFGLGTLPTMALVTTVGAVIGEKSRGVFAKLTGLIVVLLGAWTLYEGLIFYDIMRGLAN